MFNIFGLPKEVKDTCHEIESGILDNRATSTIKSAAFNLAKDKENTIYSIKNDVLTLQVLAHILITNAIQTLIGSGSYHIHRGILNFLGKEMLASWDHSVDQLERLGRHSLEEAAEDKRWLRNEIKKNG
jgi:hypothetical protein